MNSEQTRLRQQEQSVAAHAETQQVQQNAAEFSTVDDLLRHDSGLHPVPPEVAERIDASIAAEPKPERPWFKKLFG